MTAVRNPSRLQRTFAAPLAIAAASLVGLVAALVGDGLADAVSWIALAVPLGVVVWARVRRTR